MTARGNLRGHPIYWDGDQYRYQDDDTVTVGNYGQRDCGECKLLNREDGHDACLGELPGIMNACCGHGDPEEAYIQYPNGSDMRGPQAVAEMERLK